MLHTKTFGDYTILRKLGRSLTDVYLAHDTRCERDVALKIVEESPDPLTQIVIEAERRGAAIQRQLHETDPRIMEIYEYGDRDGCFFVAMEFAEGRSVSQILAEENRFEYTRAARICREIASQLETLHAFQIDLDGQQRAVVHGDIKPSNILITLAEDVKLLDFGIAKAITLTRNLTHHNLGSPAYCSPERLSNAHVDAQSDLWALGATLYEMIAGAPPYQAHDTRRLEQLIQSRRPPRPLPADCPEPLKAIIAKALSPELVNRYDSAQAFQQDLDAFVEDRQTVAASQRPAWNPNETVEKHPGRAIIRKMGATIPPPPKRMPSRRTVERAASVFGIIAGLLAGLLAGLIVSLVVHSLFAYWEQSAPFRGNLDYTHRSTAEINAEWEAFKVLERKNSFLGRFSPVQKFYPALRASYINAADEIIDRYRNSSDSAIEDFDWRKAVVCLEHAVEFNDHDRAVRGKLALSNGYVNLLTAQGDQAAQSAKASFDEAATLLPRSPDPHLALARLYVYSFHNAGRALAEFREAERLGLRLGPREMEQQGDSYRYRAVQELHEAQNLRGAHRTADALKLVHVAERDFERARSLYEPILGYSKVGVELAAVENTGEQLTHLDQDLTDPPPKPVRRRAVTRVALRTRRWR